MDSDAASPPSPRICVIYCGGTMGSRHSRDSGRLEPAPLEDFVRRVEALNPSEWGGSLSIMKIDGPLIDSAEATPADWERIRNTLARVWHEGFDGFVVVHGTDTMPYAAAFLSFAIEFQNKPVVVTGSMKPIFVDGDAAANLQASVRVACSRALDGASLDQVFLCFGGRILRGNRATKIGRGSSAIDTPKVDDLGCFDVSGPFAGMIGWRPGRPAPVVSSDRPVRFPDLTPSKVALIRIFPGISPDTVEAALTGCDAAVIEAYGSGTGPEQVRSCLETLAANGMFIVVTTEVVGGEVEVGTYETDLVRENGPLISGRWLLAEAAVAKMHYLLGVADRRRSDWRERVAVLVQRSIRGDNGPL